MTHTLNDGDRCICQEDDWHNAFGEKDLALHCGMRLTVVDSKRVGGLRFLSFKEAPKDNFYMEDGFKALRSLN